MRYENILLINPKYEKSHFYGGRSVTPPIGLGYIAEVLERLGVKVKVVDMGLNHSLKEVMDVVLKEKIEVIGVSIISYRYRPIYSMIDQIKKAFPKIPVIVGGPHMITFRKKVLEDCVSIDYGVIGQGEEAITEFFKGIDIDKIAGFVYRKNGIVMENAPRKFIEDLDGIPFPRYAAFEMAEYGKIFCLLSSRGCPSQCIYCQKTTGDRVFFRSPDNVMDEIRYWHNRGYRDFSFLDDNFTFLKKRVSDICSKIVSEGMNDSEFSAQGMRADRVDEEVLKDMKDAGFKHVSFGVEAGSDRMLGILKKGVRLETIDRAVKMATGMSFSVQLYFIIGSPHETFEDVKSSFRFALKYPVSKVIFTNMIPYPQTELFNWIKNNSRLYKNPEDYLNDIGPYEKKALFDSLGMTDRERMKALRLSAKVIKKVHASGLTRRIASNYKLPQAVAGLLAWLLSFDFVYNVATLKGLSSAKVFIKRKINPKVRPATAIYGI